MERDIENMLILLCKRKEEDDFPPRLRTHWMLIILATEGTFALFSTNNM